MTEQTINVLLIEDSADDEHLLETMLSQSTSAKFEVTVVPALSVAEDKLKDGVVDVVLLDLSLPNSNGLDSLDSFDQLRALDKNTPIIVLARHNDQSLAAKAVKKGAEDYLVKGTVEANCLERAVLYAHERARHRRQIIKLNEELIAARDQALAAAKFKSEFLAHMSHEIRTPMNAVIGMTDLLRRSPLGRDQQRFVEIIQESGRVLLDVINDILVFSRIEAGKFGLTNSVFNLLRTVEGVVTIVADKAWEKGLHLSSFVAPDVPAILSGDAQRIRQVLLNLVSNAVKYTDSGSVSVRVSFLDRQNKAVRLKFEVQDTGYGLDENEIARVFEPFIQSGRKRQQSETGSGLGLAIAKRLVQLMQGEIWADSEPGVGSTFAFTAELGLVESSETKYLVSANDLRSKRILFTELCDLDKQVLTKYADAVGIAYDIEADSKSTLKRVDEQLKQGIRYNLVFVDVRHPELPIEFQHFLKELTNRNIGIAVLRPFEQVDFVERILELELAYHLNRPLRQSEFYTCLQNVFDFEGESSGAQRKNDFEDHLLKARKLNLSMPILVVEDNQVNREVAKLQLRKLGLNPVLVSNGVQALEELKRHDYAIILMDCQMPRLDGYEATRRVRQSELEKGAHTIIIALTANALEGDREKCLDCGMDDFIAKPVTIEKLGHVLQKWQTNITGLDDSGHEPIDEIFDFSYESECFPISDAEATSDNIESQLISTYGDSAGRKIFELFRSSTPKLIAKIDGAFQNGDKFAVKKTAHELKGQCAIIKAERLATICRSLEQFAIDEDWANIEDTIERLKSLYEKIIQKAVYQETA